MSGELALEEGTDLLYSDTSFCSHSSKNGAAKLRMQPVVDSIHELFVGVEPLGSQADHLGEEMVIAWCQVRTVGRVVENLPVEELD